MSTSIPVSSYFPGYQWDFVNLYGMKRKEKGKTFVLRATRQGFWSCFGKWLAHVRQDRKAWRRGLICRGASLTLVTKFHNLYKSRQSVHGGGLLSTSSCITHVILGQSSFSPRTHMPPHTHTYTCTYLETLGISTSPVETAHKLLEKSLTGRLTHFLGIPED